MLPLSSIGTNFSARLGVGWHVLGEFYLGPETQVYGGDGYRQFRLGAHVTSMKTGDTEWSAAAGWSLDTDRRMEPLCAPQSHATNFELAHDPGKDRA